MTGWPVDAQFVCGSAGFSAITHSACQAQQGTLPPRLWRDLIKENEV
jgi:hypothetical protein